MTDVVMDTTDGYQCFRRFKYLCPNNLFKLRFTTFYANIELIKLSQLQNLMVNENVTICEKLSLIYCNLQPLKLGMSFLESKTPKSGTNSCHDIFLQTIFSFLLSTMLQKHSSYKIPRYLNLIEFLTKGISQGFFKFTWVSSHLATHELRDGNPNKTPANQQDIFPKFSTTTQT